MTPKVTILCPTYNHEAFIVDALESFVMQKTNFSFHVIVADDCSSDTTPQIITEYGRKFPDIIKPLCRNKNLGVYENFAQISDLVTSPYVALCEGDDYFTDCQKIQKQADFLDANPECSICFHPVMVKWEDGAHADSIFPEPHERFFKNSLEMKHLLRQNFIQTNSCMYRWRFNSMQTLRSCMPSDILPGDYYLHLLHAETGKIGFLKDVMAVYRRHSGGIWFNWENNDGSLIRSGIPYLNFLFLIQKNFLAERTDVFLALYGKIMLACLRTRQFSRLEALTKQYPLEFEKTIDQWNRPRGIRQRAIEAFKRLQGLSSLLSPLHVCLYLLFILQKKIHDKTC